MKIETFKELIRNLPFSGFNNLNEKKKEIWLETAEKAFKKLSVGNILIWANPGDGKTAMAILTSLGFKRTLFAAIAWEHTMQHKELYRKIIGKEEGAFIMKNKIAAGKREWNKDARITFTTTGILVNDLASGKINLSDYDLVVNDECDLAMGKHPAARLAVKAKDKRVPMLCLTATLGSKKTTEIIRRNCGIYEIIQPNIPQHPRHEHEIYVDRDDVLKEIDKLFIGLMQDDFNDLKSLVKSLKGREGINCSQEEMNTISYAIDITFGGQTTDGSTHPEYYDAQSKFAYYRKLHAAYRKCMVNSYEVFLEYAEFLEIEGNKKRAMIEGAKYTKAADRIVHDERFVKIRGLASANRVNHPKFIKLEQHLSNPHMSSSTKVVFIDEKQTAYFLARYFSEKYGLKTAAYVGSLTKAADKKAREELRLRINAGEFNVVFGTSAMERGVDLKVDEVIHYTIAMERRAREQRSGRAGRFGEGHIYQYCLKHELDQLFLFATTAPEKKEENKKSKREPIFFEGVPTQGRLDFPYKP